MALMAAADRQSHCQNPVSLMAAEPSSSPSTPSLPPQKFLLPLWLLTLTASPQLLGVSNRKIEAVAVADHSPSPNHEYILDSDHLVDYTPVDHVGDGLMSDPVDDPLIYLNTGDQHVAADVGRWKQIRVDDVNCTAHKLPSLSWRPVSIDVYFGSYLSI